MKATPEDQLLAIYAAHGITVEDRKGPTWDGTTQRWPLYTPRSRRRHRRSAHWLAHELGHFLRAPDVWRRKPNYGFGSDPNDPSWRATRRPDMSSSEIEREEVDALWLGIILGAHCGLKVYQATQVLAVQGEERDQVQRALFVLRDLGLIVHGPHLPIVGCVAPSPTALGS